MSSAEQSGGGERRFLFATAGGRGRERVGRVRLEEGGTEGIGQPYPVPYIYITWVGFFGPVLKLLGTG